MKIETILVPTDFSEDADRAIDAAIELARRFGARIDLVHAYMIDIPYATAGFAGGVVLPADFHDQVKKAATAGIERCTQKVRASGVEASGYAVPGPAALAIVDEAQRLGSDLIVMGTRGLTGLKHALLGSVAERTLRLAPCSVLTVRAKPQAA